MSELVEFVKPIKATVRSDWSWQKTNRGRWGATKGTHKITDVVVIGRVVKFKLAWSYNYGETHRIDAIVGQLKQSNGAIVTIETLRAIERKALAHMRRIENASRGPGE